MGTVVVHVVSKVDTYVAVVVLVTVSVSVAVKVSVFVVVRKSVSVVVKMSVSVAVKVSVSFCVVVSVFVKVIYYRNVSIRSALKTAVYSTYGGNMDIDAGCCCFSLGGCQDRRRRDGLGACCGRH